MRFRLQGSDFRKDVSCEELPTFGALKALIEAETGISTSQLQGKQPQVMYSCVAYHHQAFYVRKG